MATIAPRQTKKGTSYRVQVRLHGYPPATKTLHRLDDAKRWAAIVETEIREGKYFGKAEASRHTLGEMIDRFVEQEAPRRKGWAKLTHQLGWWKEEAGDRTLDRVDRVLIAPLEAQDVKAIPAPPGGVGPRSQTGGCAEWIRVRASAPRPTEG